MIVSSSRTVSSQSAHLKSRINEKGNEMRECNDRQRNQRNVSLLIPLPHPPLLSITFHRKILKSEFHIL